MVIWVSVLVYRAEAKLRLQSDSTLLVSADQTRCLVMRQIRRSPADAGRIAKLPDGRPIDLYNQFPSNGVYRLPDLEPVYFLDWFEDTNDLILSPDFNAIALINAYALTPLRRGVAGPQAPAIQILIAGKAIRTHTARELVGDPLMTTVPWNEFGARSWVESFGLATGDQFFVNTAHRGIFAFGLELPLLTGNRFVFDLATGAIVSEERPMRLIMTVSIALLVAGLLGIGSWCIWGSGRIEVTDEQRQ